MRVFLDANVLFSAAKSRGPMREVLDELRGRGHVCVADAYVIEEARRNLAAKVPDGEGSADALLTGVEVRSGGSGVEGLDRRLPLPDKDRPVLAAAIEHGCDVLVTGDRTHFGPLYGRTLHGVTIHSPRSLAESILS